MPISLSVVSPLASIEKSPIRPPLDVGAHDRLGDPRAVAAGVGDRVEQHPGRLRLVDREAARTLGEALANSAAKARPAGGEVAVGDARRC